jgi:hypothetical protein
MTLTVREMMGSEAKVIIEYFLQATPEYLEILGVDPSRLAPSAKLARALPAPVGTTDRAARLDRRHLAVGRPAGWLFDFRQDRVWRTGQHAPARD